MRKNVKKLSGMVVMAAVILFAGCGKAKGELYEEAVTAYNAANYSTALELFAKLDGFEDAAAYEEQCSYKLAYVMLQDGKTSEAESYMQNVETEELKTELEGKYQLNLAAEAMKTGEYEEALKYLEQVEEYSLKAEYLRQIAERCIDKIKFVPAQKAIDQIDIYNSEDAGELQLKLKYVIYNYDPFGKKSDDVYAYSMESVESMEESISSFYGTWYDHKDGTTVEITERTINGKPYAVHTTYSDYKTYLMIFCYTEEPQKLYCLGMDPEKFMVLDRNNELTYENLLVISDYSWYVEGLGETGIFAHSVDAERYEELSNAELEYFAYQDAQMQTAASYEVKSNFSKYDIYSTAKSEFKNWLNSRYSLTEQLYMSIDYQSADAATFSYNAAMGSYQIRFEVTVNENIFDFFGMSTSTYVVQAEYYESNGGLRASMFNVY